MNTIKMTGLDFNHSIQERLKEVCEPLTTDLGITTFAYLKFLKNGEILHITNNHHWLTYYISQNLFNNVDRYIYEIGNIPNNGAGYYLRSGKISNNFNEILEKFGLWHGLSIYIKYPEYTEAWCFATAAENYLIHDLYLNHMDILKRFILYFRSRAFDLLDHSDKSKLLITKASSFELIKEKPLEGKLKSFWEKTKINTIRLGNGVNGYHISPREAECIKFLANGKSIKEIAFLLKLSPRTVETYLESLKRKAGHPMKNDLINHFSKLPDFTLLSDFHK